LEGGEISYVWVSGGGSKEQNVGAGNGWGGGWAIIQINASVPLGESASGQKRAN
jgi:hypothetical protein